MLPLTAIIAAAPHPQHLVSPGQSAPGWKTKMCVSEIYAIKYLLTLPPPLPRHAKLDDSFRDIPMSLQRRWAREHFGEDACEEHCTVPRHFHVPDHLRNFDCLLRFCFLPGPPSGDLPFFVPERDEVTVPRYPRPNSD